MSRCGFPCDRVGVRWLWLDGRLVNTSSGAVGPRGAWNVRRANAGMQDNGWPSVAIVHSFYRSSMPSGENNTVLRQFEILAGAGVDVSLVSVSTDQLMDTPFYSVRTAWGVAHGSGLDPTPILQELAPDVVHIHNLFPNLATRWLTMYQGGIVSTLHNYRPVCAAGTLSRDGESCTLCPSGSVLQAVHHRCYRGSAIATGPLAWRNRKGIHADAVVRSSDALLVPSEWMATEYRALGLDELQVVHQPTTVTAHEHSVVPTPGWSWLFLGRISKEKGILDLVEAWPESHGLAVLGDGPDMIRLRELALREGITVDVHGHVEQARMEEILRGSAGLIVPSTWREGAPGIYADALSMGVPVIGLRGNAVYEMVQQDGTGAILEQMTSDDLVRALNSVLQNREALSQRCREVYAQRYAPEAWLDSIRPIYIEVAAGARRRHGRQ